MPKYRAKSGMEDRHGEMTGAISFNLALCALPVTLWAFFLGPWVFTSMWPTLIGALLLALILPFACMPLSRWLWAHFSEYVDRI
jgi:hypothetical protein